MRKKYLLNIAFAAALLCTSAACCAQDFLPVNTWLKDNAGVMGGRVVLMVYKNGTTLYTYVVNEMSLRQQMAYRMAARRQGKSTETERYTTTIRQPIASCSKWLSAALIMTFVDEGKLKLTDTVGTFLPILSQHGKGGITISQCLSHTTGIDEPPLKDRLKEMKNLNSMDEAIAEIAAMPMDGAPGKVFHYSNAGLQIAGAVIEKISGRDFETLFEERIAGPLDMKNTDFGKGKAPLPAGGALSTPEDYMHFLVMILNKGLYNGKRILSDNSIAQMQVNRITNDVKIAYSPAEAGNAGYGYGEWVLNNSDMGNGSNTVTSPGLFGSFPWVDNDNHYCAFLMAFNLNPTGRHERYKELKTLVDTAVK